MAKVFSADLRKLEQAVAVLAEKTDQDMTLRQLRVLLCVARAGDAGMSFEAIVQAMDSAPSSISRTVRKLGPPAYGQIHEGLGLLSLALDPTDARRRVIAITDLGWSLLRESVA